ncbi:DUF2147 domain-containing protein [Methylopila henanensis]|uniref:DUF2147 domain-containing protein n=1 Tax=Methylopila henanensis TaxID=873516 RepID=A0ABW4K3I8_9HYPH
MIRLAALAFASLVTAASAQATPVPEGLWSLSKGKVQVRIVACGEALCATVAGLAKPNDKQGRPKVDKRNPNPALRERRVIGISLLSGMKADAGGWSGNFYNPDDGETYAGRIEQGGDGKLRLKGCVLGGLICKTQVLTRIS